MILDGRPRRQLHATAADDYDSADTAPATTSRRCTINLTTTTSDDSILAGLALAETGDRNFVDPVLTQTYVNNGSHCGFDSGEDNI